MAVVLTSCAVSPAPSASIGQPSATPEPTSPYAPARVIARVLFPHPDPQTPADYQVAVTEDAIWVADARGAYLVRVDLALNRVTAITPIEPSALRAGDGQLWSVSPFDVAPSPPTLSLSRVDLATGTVEEVAKVRIWKFAVGLGAVWALDEKLEKLDPATGRSIAAWPISAEDVAVGCGSLWTWTAVDDQASTLSRIDPSSGTSLDNIALAGDPITPAFLGTADACWLVGRKGVRAIVGSQLGPQVEGCCNLTAVGDSLWGIEGSGQIHQIDPVTGKTGNYWQLPSEDLAVNAKGSADWRLLSAGSSLWLLSGAEVVRYDISTTGGG